MSESSQTLVKICGVKDIEMALAVLDSGADFLGLVFAEGSKRLVDIATAKAITDAVKSRRKGAFDSLQFVAKRRTAPKDVTEWFIEESLALREAVSKTGMLVVGVFSDQSHEYMNHVASEVGLDIIQLSGVEGFQVINEIPSVCIKAIHVGDDHQAESIVGQAVPNTASLILLDTLVGSHRGGTGQTFDWDIAAQIQASVPVMLAGGLNPGNVSQAVSKVKPWAVDVSSGVETNGAKDIEKIRQFVSAVKQTNA